jgi:hypothetical protein
VAPWVSTAGTDGDPATMDAGDGSGALTKSAKSIKATRTGQGGMTTGKKEHTMLSQNRWGSTHHPRLWLDLTAESRQTYSLACQPLWKEDQIKRTLSQRGRGERREEAKGEEMVGADLTFTIGAALRWFSLWSGSRSLGSSVDITPG